MPIQSNKIDFSIRWPTRLETAIFGVAILLIGLVLSKFMMTLGMLLIVVASLASTTLKQDLSGFLSNKAYWATQGIFLIVLLSGIYTEHWEELWGLLRVLLPFLVLPICFGLLPPIPQKAYKGLHYFFMLLMLGASIWVFTNYMLHYEAIQQDLNVSKAIPTPQRDHIRFSLLLCLAIFSGILLLEQRYYFFYKNEKWLIALAMFLMWLLLHVLSVRSGLLAFYAGIFVYILRLIVVKRRWILGCLLLSVMVAAPILAYRNVPSFHQKVHLTLYNWHQYQEGKIGQLSDTQRLLSYQVAFQVASQNPWIGIGMGDLHAAQQKIYERDYPEQGVMHPHNQFLTFYAGSGWLGLAAFLGCFFFPLFYRKAYRDIWCLLFFTVIFSSFLTENTIFIAIGTAMYTLFLLLFINQRTGKE